MEDWGVVGETLRALGKREDLAGSRKEDKILNRWESKGKTL